ncbi:Uncharacterized membrane protein, DUF1819 [Desulfonema limicola]|uniref:Uncharacterized membrane protein, DUF1819 n=1 Tax=Desulfonema limicola TaxID=45656 RepID=A0A975BBC8_9BACT|nr:DUF1819 family protein [Desulfonema limicola]QTA82150.1 Uncharacterized membrane protein, DUF1819 [Desulfonema limicola]
MDRIEYKSSITTGSLLVRESRIIARLLLDNVDNRTWYQAVIIDNVLQKRSLESAKRQAGFVKERLTLMEPELWRLIDKGSSDVAVQAVLAASIKHSHLLGDFMNKVVRLHWQVFKKRISAKDWQEYIEMCTQVDPKIQNWTTATKAKLKQIVFRILAEADYINNTRSCELIPVTITPDVKTYLINNSENYVLKCMEITP